MKRPGANGNGAAVGECGCCGGNGEFFSLLRNRTVNVSRTVNASVGHSPGIGYPSSCLIPDKTQEVKIRTSPFNYNHLFGKNT